MRKKSLCLTSLAILATSGLVSCGGSNNNDNNNPDPNPKPETPTIKYQFSGHYTDETLTGYGYDWYILLNLYSDGSVKGSGYNILSMDSSSYDKNTGFRENWYIGKWKDAVNEEDLSYIDLSVSYSSDAKNDMGGNTLTGSFNYEIYEKSDKTMSFTIDVPVFSGRKQEITSSGTINYKTLDEFIQKNLYTWTEPESIAVFNNEEGSLSRIYVQNDGKALCYNGKVDPATKDEKYVISGTWSWKKDGDKLIFNDGNVDHEVSVDGKKGTIEYEQSLMGHTIKFKYICEDITPILEANGSQEEAAKELAKFVTSDGASSISLFDDHTAKLVAFGGSLNVNYTWALNEDLLTLVDSVDSNKKLETTIADNKAEINYSANLAGHQIDLKFTCNDLTDLVEFADSEVKTLAIFENTDKTATLTVLSNGTANLVAYGGMLKPVFNWKYENKKLIFTDSVNPDKTMEAVIDGKSATITYSDNLGGNPISIELSCADISSIIE